jgi:hypothetical protein
MELIVNGGKLLLLAFKAKAEKGVSWVLQGRRGPWTSVSGLEFSVIADDLLNH